MPFPLPGCVSELLMPLLLRMPPPRQTLYPVIRDALGDKEADHALQEHQHLKNVRGGCNAGARGMGVGLCSSCTENW